MNLTTEEKEVIARALSFYCENHIRTEMVRNSNAEASKEDYKVRGAANKLGIRNMLSDNVQQGF